MTDFLKKFSSPLGDGLVQNNLKSKTIIGKFSSPSGDGLVHVYEGLKKQTLPRFSSPLGDGLVRTLRRL